MSFDTKYRPTQYEDVLGQEAAVQVLRGLVKSGAGFHQSYVFCGQHGSGKTTLGRILCRALLCDDPQDGAPCDQCSSCQTILQNGSSEAFIEVDAATNSGKADIKQIVEELQYSTFSGKQRIYLFDEAHELSRQALDGLLKPMEDTSPGSDNKLLVCVFCTTEPEKMRSTIFSRCAPAFTIRQVPPDKIGERLAYVCDQEGIEYDQDALTLIAEAKESHIRPALKSLEAISKLGKVTEEAVRQTLRLDIANTLLSILASLGRDQAAVMASLDAMQQVISPADAYGRLANMAISLYKHGMGLAKLPRYWDQSLADEVVQHQGDYLLAVAERLSTRPMAATGSMLVCDLMGLHHQVSGTGMAVSRTEGLVERVSPPSSLTIDSPTPPLPAAHTAPPSSAPLPDRSKTPVPDQKTAGKVSTDPTEKSISDPSEITTTAVGDDAIKNAIESESLHPSGERLAPLPTDIFRWMLRRRVAELRVGSKRGSQGWPDMGGY